MALEFKDRVRGTTTTTGTGTYTVLGAPTGFQGFDELTTGNTLYYCVVFGNDFEVGLGTLTLGASDTLSRDTILDSSSGGAVNWGVGEKEIFLVLPAAVIANLAVFDALAKTDGNFIVGDGSTWVAENGATARASMGADNATNLTSGTLPDARFPATLPALSGVNLTALNASALASGTVADARLSANVPLLNAANTFTAAQTITTAGAANSLSAINSANSVTGWFGAGSASVFLGSQTAHALQFYTGNALRAFIAGDGSEFQVDATLLDFNGAADFSSTVTATGTLTASAGLSLGSIQSIVWADDTDTGIAYGATNTLHLYAGGLSASFSQSEIDLTATTLDLNGNLDADGTTLDIDGATSLGLHGGSADITLSGTEADITATTIDINGSIWATSESGGFQLLQAVQGNVSLHAITSGDIELEADAGNVIVSGHVDIGVRVGGVKLGLEATAGFSPGLHMLTSGGTNQLTYLTGGGTRGLAAEWQSGRFSLETADVEFPNISTTASAANAFLDSGDGNSILRSTSSAQYKRDIRDLTAEESVGILNLRPVAYRSRIERDGDGEYIGLVAEEVANVDPRLVHYMNNKPDGVMYDRITVGLLGLVKQLYREVELLKYPLN